MSRHGTPKAVLHCLECGHTQQESRSVLGRNTKVHCTMCGGMLEESAVTRATLVTGMDRRKVNHDRWLTHSGTPGMRKKG